MKIYFAGSIRGGREDRDLYAALIRALEEHGEILTEHVGAESLSAYGEEGMSDREIFDRDMSWLREADLLVAEVTTPSLGVGYEIACAEKSGKPVLCLYRERPGKRLSAMLAGNRSLTIGAYKNLDEARAHLSAFLASHGPGGDS